MYVPPVNGNAWRSIGFSIVLCFPGKLPGFGKAGLERTTCLIKEKHGRVPLKYVIEENIICGPLRKYFSWISYRYE